MSNTLTIKTQVMSQVQDPVAAVNITQIKDFTDNSLSQSLNFTIETYELPVAGAPPISWTKIMKGDIGVIREVFIILTSTLQDEGVEVLITSDPAPAAATAATFKMRECFVATTEMDTAQAIWVRNLGSAVADLLSILGGVNV
jgi:hypothetical protein